MNNLIPTTECIPTSPDSGCIPTSIQNCGPQTAACAAAAGVPAIAATPSSIIIVACIPILSTVANCPTVGFCPTQQFCQPPPTQQFCPPPPTTPNVNCPPPATTWQAGCPPPTGNCQTHQAAAMALAAHMAGPFTMGCSPHSWPPLCPMPTPDCPPAQAPPQTSWCPSPTIPCNPPPPPQTGGCGLPTLSECQAPASFSAAGCWPTHSCQSTLSGCMSTLADCQTAAFAWSPVFYPIQMPGLGHIRKHAAGPPQTFSVSCTLAGNAAPRTAPMDCFNTGFPTQVTAGCPAPAPQAQASPGTIMTLPPICFGAAPAGHTGAVNGVQSLPPACFGAQAAPPTQITTGCPAPHALAQASPDTIMTLPPWCFGVAPAAHDSMEAGPPTPPTMQCGPKPPVTAHPCLSPTWLCGGPVSLLCHQPPSIVPCGPPPTHMMSGCPVQQAQASPGTIMTLPPACFGAAAPSTFGIAACPPTLGSPCHHPTISGPACAQQTSEFQQGQGNSPVFYPICMPGLGSLLGPQPQPPDPTLVPGPCG